MSSDDLINVDVLSRRILDHADKLREVSRVFNGYEDPESKEKFPGTKLRYEEALDDELDKLADHYEDLGKRPPAKEILLARARKAVKKSDPDLYTDYFIQEATKQRIERWLADSRSALFGRQAVLKTEREMNGYYGRQSQAGVGQ